MQVNGVIMENDQGKEFVVVCQSPSDRLGGPFHSEVGSVGD